jgi:integrase
MPVHHLTATNLRSLPAIDGKKTEYFDEDVTGLALRVYPRSPSPAKKRRRGSGRVWYLVYRRHASTRYYKIGDLESFSLADARKHARDLRARVQLGGDPQSERLAERQRARQSVAHVCNAFLKEKGPELSERTVDEWRRIVENEIAAAPIGKRPAAELTRGEVKEWSDKIKERSKHGAAHAFAVLRRVYSWAVGEDKVPGSPFAGLQPPAHPPSDVRILTPRELRALMLALGDCKPRRRRKGTDGTLQPGGSQVDAVRLILLTLSRASMVTGLALEEVEDLDSRQPRWVVPPRPGLKRRGRTGGTPHVVPLVQDAVDIVKRRLEAIGPDGRLLFPAIPASGERPKRSTSITQRFMRQLRAAMDVRYAADEMGKDLDAADPRDAQKARETVMAALAKGKVDRRPHWKIHDLRHTAATQLREYLNVDAEVVSLLLAHTRPVRKGAAEVTRIYDRSELLGQRRAALVAWAAWLEALAAGTGVGLPARVLPMSRGQ